MLTIVLSGAALFCLSTLLWGLVASRKQIKEDAVVLASGIHNLFTKERASWLTLFYL